MPFMRITILLLQIAAVLVALLLFTQSPEVGQALVWMLLVTLPAFVLEALGTLLGAARFFSSSIKD